jgi:hypothetical protein
VCSLISNVEQSLLVLLISLISVKINSVSLLMLNAHHQMTIKYRYMGKNVLIRARLTYVVLCNSNAQII